MLFRSMRGPLSHSVTELRLWSLCSCTVSGFLRFLNSFRSLLDLLLRHDIPSFLRNSGQILPPPYPLPSRSLMSLYLEVAPGVDKLIEWYIREGSFLARIKMLNLSWDIEAEGGIHFGVLKSLLHHCMGSLEDLTLTVFSSVNEGPLMEKIADNSMLSHIHHASRTNDTPVVLSSLPNLRRMKSWCGHSSVFQIASTQLCSIREPCKIEDIILVVSLTIEAKDYEKSRNYCKRIDEALTSDNFPSLRSVQLFREIPFDYFPTLQSRKLLRVYGS